MGIIRTKKTKNFTIIANEALRRNDLSAKAKGIYAYLMTLPDDWEIHISELVNHFSDGRDSIYSGIKELKNAGYLVAEGKKAYGKFDGINYTLMESAAEIPHTENPHTEKPSLPKTNRLNTNNTNTSTSSEVFAPVDDDVTKVYKAYPSKDPLTKRPLAKGARSIKLIEKAIKQHNADNIVKYINDTIESNKQRKDKTGFSASLPNFNSFLNNLPLELDEPESDIADDIKVREEVMNWMRKSTYLERIDNIMYLTDEELDESIRQGLLKESDRTGGFE